MAPPTHMNRRVPFGLYVLAWLNCAWDRKRLNPKSASTACPWGPMSTLEGFKSYEHGAQTGSGAGAAYAHGMPFAHAWWPVCMQTTKQRQQGSTAGQHGPEGGQNRGTGGGGACPIGW